MNQNIRIIARLEKYKLYEPIVMPKDRCQVCLSRTDFQESVTELPDKLVKCVVCLSSIHQKHYGGDLCFSVPQNWHCQRCAYMIKHAGTLVKCEFCPDIRGIMKIVQYQKKKFWAHPECIIWDYPIKLFTCLKMVQFKKLPPAQNEFEKFWYPEHLNPKCCECGSSFGEFVKCRYYTCENHYHVPCARKLGVIRELEQMRVCNNGEYTYIPVLCTEHLQKRGIDFRNKANKTEDKEKLKYLTNLAKIYEKQYWDLLRASKEDPREMNFKITYQEEHYLGIGVMEEELVQEPSQETPIADQSAPLSQNFIDFIVEEMKDVFDDVKFSF